MSKKAPPKKPNPSENETVNKPPTDKERKEGGMSPAPKGYKEGGSVKSGFQKAFAEARKKHGAGGTFEYNGKTYNTMYAEEKKARDDAWRAVKEDGETQRSSGPSTRGVAKRPAVSSGPSTRGVAKRPAASSASASDAKSSPRMGVHNFTEKVGKPFLARFGTTSQREKYSDQGYKKGGSVRGVGCATKGYGKAMKG